ncbi:MAG: DUF3833 domain-containing protein [Alphaproteobacteria bacterium]|nr:MAG: DUF3833 domain-containing protein [Alphaproteobacteria bacterium]
MRMRFLLVFLGFLTVSGCGSSMTVQDFKMQPPTLALENYFQGRVKASGLFEDRFGNVRNQFTVMINGTWDGQTLILDEDFDYIDGSRENRRWTIVKDGPGRYRGTTEQAVGEAIGETAGNSFNWRYSFNLKVGDDTWRVKFDDWMFLQPDGTLLNKATIYRWGFKIGTVFLTFHKLD